MNDRLTKAELGEIERGRLGEPMRQEMSNGGWADVRFLGADACEVLRLTTELRRAWQALAAISGLRLRDMDSVRAITGSALPEDWPR